MRTDIPPPPPAAPGKVRLRAAWMAAGVLALCLGATVAAWWQAREGERAGARHAFEVQNREVVFKLRERLQAYSQILRGAAGLMTSSGAVTRAEWRRYVTQLDLNRQYPGIQGVGYAEWLRPSGIGPHQARARLDGFDGYAVRPAGGREAYAPVTYLEPMTWRNQRALGYDMYSEPVRRAAIDYAMESADIGMSGRVTLVQETENEPQPGFLMYYPVYARGATPSGSAERRSRIAGFAYAPFRMLDLMASALPRRDENIALRIVDGSGRSEDERLLYDSHPGTDLAGGRFDAGETIHFGGHSWTVAFRGTPAFEAAVPRTHSASILGAGLLLSLLFALLTWHLASARGRAEAQARDMTRDLRASREGAEQARRQMQGLLDAATEVAFIAADVEGVITLFNRGAERMLGYAAIEVVGRQTPALFHDPAEVAARGAELTAEMGRGVSGFAVFVTQARLVGAEQREWTYRRRDGSTLKVSLVVTAVYDGAGELTGFLGVAKDITEYKQAEARLKQLSQAVRQSPVSIVITDRNGHIEYVNPKFERVTGYLMQEVLGENPRMLQSGETQPETYVEMWRAISGGGEWQGEFHNRKKSGELYWEHARISPILDRQGAITHYLAVKEDITERKRIEEELARHRGRLEELVREQTEGLIFAKEAAERANRAKSEFLANMSHELRTPMHAILGFARLGHDKSGGEARLHGYFERIRNGGERLLTLLNDLLDLSKLEAGRMVLDLRRHDLAALVREVVAELEPLAVARRQRVALPEQSVIAAVDASRFAQVVRNLLANAIKFTPEGRGIAVALAPARLPAGRRATDHGELAAAALTVRDEGIGIPESELESVFDKFVQSSKTKSGAGGTGLGLAICREIVEAHGGSIRAGHAPGGGAEFTVTVPVAPHPRLGEPAQAEQHKEPA